ncbi:hypothetical protein SCUP515_07165 [Seiridium cupressi]
MEYRRKTDEPSSAFQRFGRWLRLKQYQVEVTFAVYMFTPTEKFVFWSVVFLLFSMTTIAAALYLPQHLAFLIDRAWFYVNGGEASSGAAASLLANTNKEALSLSVTSLAASTASAATEAAGSTIRELVRSSLSEHSSCSLHQMNRLKNDTEGYTWLRKSTLAAIQHHLPKGAQLRYS